MRHHSLPALLFLSIVSLMAAACHQQTRGPASTRASNVMTELEIDSAHAANVYELVARYRAAFLNDRGNVSILSNKHARAVVFMNDQEYGIPETMRNIPPDRISEIRFYSGTDAAAKFGSQYGGGVIQLISRHQ